MARQVFVISTLVLLAVTVTRSQQCSSGCAAGPTVIQLQCGANGAASPAPAPAPPAPSPPKMPEDYDPWMCDTDQNNFFYKTPPGGFPVGFRSSLYCYGEKSSCSVVLSWDDDEVRAPPPGWTGQLETLGFPVEKGTKQYNMLMCWVVPTVGANYILGFTGPNREY